jgi:hypothetical protein
MNSAATWADLSTGDLTLWFLPAAVLAVSLLLPGRRVALASAVAVAVATPLIPEHDMPWPLLLAWMGLWITVAIVLAKARRPAQRWTGKPSGFESGAVGLMLGAALLALLIAAIVRQRLPIEYGLRSALGVSLIAIGLLHLMLRRDSMRAVIAFAALGFGIQWLDLTARQVLLPIERRGAWVTLLVTVLAVGLMARIAYARQREAGSSWVSDAHDLHD